MWFDDIPLIVINLARRPDRRQQIAAVIRDFYRGPCVHWLEASDGEALLRAGGRRYAVDGGPKGQYRLTFTDEGGERVSQFLRFYGRRL